MHITIIDDHLLFVESLKSLLGKSYPGATITTYIKGLEFLSLDFSKDHPDLVLVDIAMPDINGIELVKKAKAILGDRSKYLILTSLHDIDSLKNAIKAGASGYLSKDVSEEELYDAFRTIFNDEVPYIQKSLKDKLVAQIFFTEEKKDFHLSQKEMQVINGICSGKISKEMALEMGLSINTIHQYIKTLKRKFQVRRTTDVALFAVENGLYKKE